MTLVISSAGEITILYQEVLDLAELGAQRIERASHVEPDDLGQWWAQIIDGPKLGPFSLRSEALAAEVVWLVKNRLDKQCVETPALVEKSADGATRVTSHAERRYISMLR